MTKIESVVRKLALDIGARPTGTPANEEASKYLRAIAEELGYQVGELPFACKRWEHGESHLQVGDASFPIHASPFSRRVEGRFLLETASSLAELDHKQVTGKVLVLRGALAAEPMMPKDFPFYYPDEHRKLNDTLEAKRPAAILALTGKHPMCGWNPFPLFEDGILSIPNAYAAECSEVARRVVESVGVDCSLLIDSRAEPAQGRQLILSKAGARKERIVLCAHMDTKYGTPGALDNATGVAILVGVMERLRRSDLAYGIDFVPFNGEEYYEVPGQLAYLGAREPLPHNTRLVINFDLVGHRNSQNAVSLYNIEGVQAAAIQAAIARAEGMAVGEPWVASDHSIFAFRGIPCMAVTSSDLFEGPMQISHTEADTVELVDFALLERTADWVAHWVGTLAA